MCSSEPLHRLTNWVLIFATPSSAKEYQTKLFNLRNVAQETTNTLMTSQVTSSSAFKSEGLNSGLHAYTLGSPWEFPSLCAYIAPFQPWLQEAIDSHTRGIRRSHGNRKFSVRLTIDPSNIDLNEDTISQFLQWDGNARGTQWRLVESPSKIRRFGQKSEDYIWSEEAHMPRNESTQWCLNFDSAGEAERFVRTWNNRRLRKFGNKKLSDTPPLVTAKCVFYKNTV